MFSKRVVLKRTGSWEGRGKIEEGLVCDSERGGLGCAEHGSKLKSI
jgi:hypothetical protein